MLNQGKSIMIFPDSQINNSNNLRNKFKENSIF